MEVTRSYYHHVTRGLLLLLPRAEWSCAVPVDERPDGPRVIGGSKTLHDLLHLQGCDLRAIMSGQL